MPAPRPRQCPVTSAVRGKYRACSVPRCAARGAAAAGTPALPVPLKVPRNPQFCQYLGKQATCGRRDT
eukprot:gene23859-biopygen22344